MKKTKIVCTIGPSTNKIKVLMKLLNSGMDVARLNFSHGNIFEHQKCINNLKCAMKLTKKKIAILLDTKGPEIRTLSFKDSQNIFLQINQLFTFVCDKQYIGDSKSVGISYENLVYEVNVGNLILVDDGLISMKVIEVLKDYKKIVCKVLNSGILGINKGINLPGSSITLPSLTDQDKKDLVFACKNKIDFVAASFIRQSSDVLEIRNLLKYYKGDNIQIISKIETKEGLRNFDDILNVSDGIMVARGDLGVEIPVEEVIFAQKMMISKCNYFCKVVITATQMLESMINNPRPTRAEAGDVANAVLDGTDAVMLSAESAKGSYPVETVQIMSNICKRTDMSMQNYKPLYNKKDIISISEVICKSSVDIATKLKCSLIIVYTKRGKSALFIRKYFPYSLILALTENKIISKQLLLVKGVIPLLLKNNSIFSIDDFYNLGKDIAISRKYGKKNDIVVMVSGALVFPGISNTISIHIL